MPDSDGHPALQEMRFGNVLAALADPHRRSVVAALLKQPEGTERTCVSFALPVSKSTLTYHFRMLREAGLIRQVDRGNSRKVRLRKADIDQRFPGLLQMLRDEDAT